MTAAPRYPRGICGDLSVESVLGVGSTVTPARPSEID